MRTVLLGDRRAPVLGQGTWRLGEDPSRASEETKALREGVALGMTLIDTAEMYGDGATESFLGQALAGLRNEVFLVSKVYPQNAGRDQIKRSCEASLRRLRTDRLDLYLLHWRGAIPLDQTVAGMEDLKAAGKIGAWGVSNFDASDMQQLSAAGGDGCVANQILYNLTRRGPEFELFSALSASGVACMAYSPIEQGRLPASKVLDEIGLRHSVSAFEVALAWVLRHPSMMAIPKAGATAHVLRNARAAQMSLTADELLAIDTAFPPPRRKTPLEML